MSYTIAETEEFIKQVDKIWTQDERLEFFQYLANNPLEGDVIPKAHGLRKIRWLAKGHGKQGGARVIYYNMLADGIIVRCCCNLRQKPNRKSTTKDVKEPKIGAKHERFTKNS